MSIKKIEAGKTYRLIDKEAYFAADESNVSIYHEFFKEGCVTIYGVNDLGTGLGYDGDYLIYPEELKYFEECDSVESSQTLSRVLDKLQHMSLNEIAKMCVDKGWEV